MPVKPSRPAAAGRPESLSPDRPPPSKRWKQQGQPLVACPRRASRGRLGTVPSFHRRTCCHQPTDQLPGPCWKALAVTPGCDPGLVVTCPVSTTRSQATEALARLPPGASLHRPATAVCGWATARVANCILLPPTAAARLQRFGGDVLQQFLQPTAPFPCWLDLAPAWACARVQPLPHEPCAGGSALRQPRKPCC